MMLLCAIGASGCAKKKSASSANSAGAKTGKQTVTTEKMTVGQVATVNAVGHFVVLNFSGGKVPATNQQLAVYRHDVKVGDVKITGPQQGDNIVADIVSGEPEVSDEVRGN